MNVKPTPGLLAEPKKYDTTVSEALVTCTWSTRTTITSKIIAEISRKLRKQVELESQHSSDRVLVEPLSFRSRHNLNSNGVQISGSDRGFRI